MYTGRLHAGRTTRIFRMSRSGKPVPAWDACQPPSVQVTFRGACRPYSTRYSADAHCVHRRLCGSLRIRCANSYMAGGPDSSVRAWDTTVTVSILAVMLESMTPSSALLAFRSSRAVRTMDASQVS
ncbi:hypothetical protein OH77DRAFT_661323 [Trametes cingulata]|nr:hypothetical protein OH77DRAFT_661323 [Trametes cingulata]